MKKNIAILLTCVSCNGIFATNWRTEQHAYMTPDTISFSFNPVNIRIDNTSEPNSMPNVPMRSPAFTPNILYISGHTLRLSGEMVPGMVEIAVHEPDARSASLWETSVMMAGKTAYVELPEWLSGSYAIRLRTSEAAYIGTIDL